MCDDGIPIAAAAASIIASLLRAESGHELIPDRVVVKEKLTMGTDWIVGPIDGTAVGLGVGFAVGIAVGMVVGVHEGDGVGLAVGGRVGVKGIVEGPLLG